MSTETPKWELINGGMGSSAEVGPWVSRFPVPGGWLYRIDFSDQRHTDVQTVFVPDPDVEKAVLIVNDDTIHDNALAVRIMQEA